MFRSKGTADDISQVKSSQVRTGGTSALTQREANPNSEYSGPWFHALSSTQPYIKSRQVKTSQVVGLASYATFGWHVSMMIMTRDDELFYTVTAVTVTD